jgi:hypothetical protein
MRLLTLSVFIVYASYHIQLLYYSPVVCSLKMINTNNTGETLNEQLQRRIFSQGKDLGL